MPAKQVEQLEIPQNGQAMVPMQAMVDRFIEKGASIEQLEKLLAMNERFQAMEAKKAFVMAMNAFKADPPLILKTKQVSFGTTNYKYAPLDEVCAAVIKGLSKHGISHRWTMRQEAGQIEVTCILTHYLGHSESTTLSGMPDTSGSKNSIQAIGSAVSYLQRYTLFAATGLAASNGDDDGRGGVQVNNGDLAESIEWLQNASTLEELQKLFKQAYLKYEGNKPAQQAVIRAKDMKKKELQ